MLSLRFLFPRRWWPLWLTAIGLLLAAPLKAEVVTWLYQVEVPVADQSERLRSAAARSALRTVLTRISGVAELPLDPVLTAAERNPGRYYTSFQYLAAQPQQPLSVRFAFDPALTLRLSKALELPVWWQNRPRVVPWLSIDGEQLVMDLEPGASLPGSASMAAGEPTSSGAPRPKPESSTGRPRPSNPAVLPADDVVDPAVALAAAITRRARERGLPLGLPTPDVDGLEPLAPQRVELADPLELLSASTGLGAEWLGQGRIEQRAGTWFAALRFEPVNALSPEVAPAPAPLPAQEPASAAPGAAQLLTDEITFNVQAVEPADLGVQIVDQLSDALAQRYAASGGGALTLRVQGVTGAQSLVALLRYLRGLSFLDAVQITESGPAGLLLTLDSQADFEQFKRLLAVDARLLPEPTDAPVAVFGPPVFRWQG